MILCWTDSNQEAARMWEKVRLCFQKTWTTKTAATHPSRFENCSLHRCGRRRLLAVIPGLTSLTTRKKRWPGNWFTKQGWLESPGVDRPPKPATRPEQGGDPEEGRNHPVRVVPPSWGEYDTVATVPERWVWWRAVFQSGSRVLKKVFWTFFSELRSAEVDPYFKREQIPKTMWQFWL